MPDAFRDRYGPVALVAGAAVGLGAEYARQLAARGLDLVLVDRETATLDDTARALRSQTQRDVRTIVLDLAREDVA